MHSKILLFKVGALGDVLMTTPLVHALRKQYPDARIDYFIGAWSAPAIKNNSDITNIYIYSDPRRVSGLVWNMLPFLIRHLFFYDVVIVLDKAWQLNVLGRFFAKKAVGFTRRGSGWALSQCVKYDDAAYTDAVHDIVYYLKIGELLGCSSRDVGMKFSISNADRKRAEELLGGISGNIVALCPGGACNPYQIMGARRWPIEKYAALAKDSISQGASVVLVGGSGDIEEESYILDACNKSGCDMKKMISCIGKTTFSESAAAMAACSVVVSHDTSTMHLASAIHVPVVALFGPTNPWRKHPLNPGSTFIYHPSKCTSCGMQVCHWEYKHVQEGCSVRMDAISTDEVMERVVQRWQ